jgi:hypothetical protein
MYTFQQAAKYLERNPQTLEGYQRNGWLIPDLRYGTIGARMYKKETLDKFKRTYLNSSLPTLDEIAARYAKTTQCVKYHFRTKRKIKPAGLRDTSITFDWNDVFQVANELGWTKNS